MIREFGKRFNPWYKEPRLYSKECVVVCVFFTFFFFCFIDSHQKEMKKWQISLNTLNEVMATRHELNITRKHTSVKYSFCSSLIVRECIMRKRQHRICKKSLINHLKKNEKERKT